MTQSKHNVGDILTIEHNTTDHGFLIGDEVLINEVFISEETGYVSYEAQLLRDSDEFWFIDDDDLSE